MILHFTVVVAEADGVEVRRKRLRVTAIRRSQYARRKFSSVLRDTLELLLFNPNLQIRHDSFGNFLLTSKDHNIEVIDGKRPLAA